MNTKKKYCLLLVFLCFASLVNGAEILRYVDTGSDAAGDGTTSATSSGDNTHAYQSLNALEAAEEADLDTANNQLTAHCNRTNSGGQDTTSVRFDGWTTSATDFIKVIADDFPADGIYDSTKYLLHNNDSTSNFVDLREDFVRLEKLQVLVTETSTNSRSGLVITATVGAGDIRFDSCIIKGACSGTGTAFGIDIGDADITVTIFNTIITGFFISADSGFRGINISNATAVNIYNCSIYNSSRGINQATGTVTLINGAVFNNTDDLVGTITSSYTATDDGDAGTGNVTITQSADDWAALVVDAAGDDFAVTDASSELYQTGNGATPKSTFTDDIIDTERDAVDLNWDIGAFELIAVAPAGGQVIMIQTGGIVPLVVLLAGSIIYMGKKKRREIRKV